MSAGGDDFRSRFVLGPVLGEGGYGVVVRAEDRSRGEPVALKRLHRATPHAIYRFKAEFRSVAHLAHPNLVRLHELWADGADWYVSMELVDGEPILQWVRPGWSDQLEAAGVTLDERDLDLPDEPVVPTGPRGALDLARVRSGFRQLAEGVAFLHGAGQIHRDLKPSNVLVERRTGRVVILDFGLATDVEVDQQTRALGGTPRYMAPEQGGRNPITPAADWYAFGVMLYEALTGEPPFGGSRLDMVAQKAVGRPPLAGERQPGVPADLEALCDGLLSPEPESRPGATEILAVLGSRAVPRRRGRRLVGRGAAMAALQAAWSSSRGGYPVLVSLQGPSGVGKSALLSAFADELRALPDRSILVRGRCHVREVVPLKAVDALVDGLARQLRALSLAEREAVLPRYFESLIQMFPAMGSVGHTAPPRERPLDAREQRRRAVRALRELLARLAERAPVALVLDDVQWSDEDSAALLAEVFRPPDPPALMLVLASRSGTMGPVLREATALWAAYAEGRAAPRSVTVVLDALSPEEAVALALAAGRGALDVAGAERVAAEGRGVPWFVEQLAEERARQPGEQGGLESLLLNRAASTGMAAYRVLQIAAVAGRPLPPELLARAAGVPLLRIHAELDRLEDAHLVQRRDDGAVWPWHDRVTEAVVGDLGEAEVRSAHSALADALLAGVNPDPEAVAVHLDAAGRPEAAAWRVRAGDAALAALAFEQAAVHLARARALGENGEPVAMRLADALAWSGRSWQSASLLLELGQSKPGLAGQRLRARAVQLLLLFGHHERAMPEVERLADELGHPLSRGGLPTIVALIVARLRLWWRARRPVAPFRPEAEVSEATLTRLDVLWALSTGLSMVDQIQSAVFQARSHLVAMDGGEVWRFGRSLGLQVAHSAVGGTRTAAATAALLAEAQKLLMPTRDPRNHGLYHSVEAIATQFIGQFPASLRACELSEHAYRDRCRSVEWELDLMRRFELRNAHWLGDFRRVVERYAEMELDVKLRGAANVSLQGRIRNLHVARLTEDRAEGLVAEIEGMLGPYTPSPRSTYLFPYFLRLIALVETALYLQDGAGAWARVEQDWPALSRSLLLRVQITRIEVWFLRGRAALASAPVRGAAALVEAERAARQLRKEQAAWADVLAQLLESQVAWARGDRDRWRTGLTAAGVALEGLSMRGYAAAAAWQRGLRDGGAESPPAWFNEQGVRNPDRMTRMLLGG